MGAHLGAEAVLERRDDPPAVGVVLGVGAGHEQQVQRQPHPVAADLDVALLEHVEQRHLDALGEVGQLVDAEDAAVGARDQPVVDGLRVAQGAALGHLDRVDVADQVADAGVRGGQLLAEAVAAVQPADRGGVAVLGDLAVRPDRDRVQRVLVQLAADQDRRPLVEQADERADQPGLALAALTEQHEVVAGDEGPLDLGEDGVLEPDHAGEAGLAAAEPGEQVGAQFGLDRPEGRAAGAEFAERRGGGGRGALGGTSVTSTTVRREGRRPGHGVLGERRPAKIATCPAPTCPPTSRPRHRCGCRGRGRAARRRRPAHPAVALAGPGRQGRRPGVAQVREPAADGVVQDPGGVHPHRPADRRRAGPRGRGRQRGQPRPGGRPGRPPPRHLGHRLHARDRAAAEGGGHPRLRGGGPAAGPVADRAARGGRRVRRADRLGVHPPVRAPRRHRRPGHGRPRDPRAVPRRRDRRRLRRGRRPGVRASPPR